MMWVRPRSSQEHFRQNRAGLLQFRSFLVFVFACWLDEVWTPVVTTRKTLLGVLLARYTPGRGGLPSLELVERPLCGFIGVAGGAGIWDFELFGQARRNKLESMGADHVVAQCLLDLRHVARGALAGRAVRCVMRMFGDRTFQAGRTCGAIGAVTRHAKIISGLN